MALRGTNFVSSIQDISLIKNQIQQLIDGDVYYFSSYINGANRVFYVTVIEHPDGEEFIFCRDFKKYFYESISSPTSAREDLVIKIITSSANTPASVPPLATYSATPAKAISDYIDVYLDALQTTSMF